MTILAPIAPEHLRPLADVLAEHLSHREISEVARMCGLTDVSASNKPTRVCDILAEGQRRYSGAHKVIEFVEKATAPAKFTKDREAFGRRRDELNHVLAFAGYQLGDDGKMALAKPAGTLREAEQRARSLRTELTRRSVHPEVLRFCRAELLEHNFFHAVLESVKSVAEHVRSKTKLHLDGHALVDAAFGSSAKLGHLALNDRTTDSKKSEHTGFVNLLKFLFSTFRNPAAHEPKILRPMDESQALEVLTMVSYAHRQLDSVAVVPAALVGMPVP